MKEIMSCEQFAKQLDAFLDSELGAIQRSAFIEHARTCPECGELLEMSTNLLTSCAELDVGLQMPIEGQAAWRKAVREEAQKPHVRTKLPAFVRGLASVAAALLLLCGGTYAYNNMGSLSPDALPLIVGSASRPESSNAQVEREADVDYLAMSVPRSADMGEIRIADGSDDATFIMSDEPEWDNSDEKTAPDVFAQPITESGFDPDVPAEGIKEIRYASRTIETAEYDADLGAVKDLISEYDGRIDDESGYGEPIAPGQDYGRNANLSARIPTDDLDAFLVSLDAVGIITGRSEGRQEITRQYYDAAARLESRRLLGTRLEELMIQAQSVSELIEIERELANVRAEMDSYQSQLNAWSSEIAYSSVSIYVNEVADRLAVQPIDSESLLERIREGFAESINMLSRFAQDMLVFMVLFWPWIVLVLIVVIVVCTSIGRRRRRRA